MSEQQSLRNEFDLASPSENQKDDIWRREIHSRVDRYRTRRGRRIEGAYSMRFPFPPPAEAARPTVELPTVSFEPEVTEAEINPTAARENYAVKNQIAMAVEEMVEAENAPVPSAFKPELLADAALARESVADESLALGSDAALVVVPARTVPRPRTRRKVIAFPRHLMATPDVAYQLADPVIPAHPRILDVPEELEALHATPFLDGLTFDGRTHAPSSHPEHLELPCPPVALSQRLYAVAVDALVVGVAVGLFGAVAYKLIPNLQPGKSMLMAAAVVPALLWFVYEYLLLVYGGTTLGMRVAKIRLLTFAGEAPNLRQRRNRALGLCLSTASLTMGLLWAFVDVNALCWHDRTSQTFLTGE